MSLLLGWWRWHHNSWLTTIYAAVVACWRWRSRCWCWARASTRQDRRAGDILLLGGIAPLTVAAAAAPPGPVGSPQAVLGFGVLTVAAAIALKFTGRRLSTYTAIITIGLVATIASLARMVAATSAVTLLSCVVLVCVLAYHFAPALSRRLSGIRLPVFPSATSRWVFEARPDLPTTVVRTRRCRRRSWKGRLRCATCCCRPSGPGRYLSGLLVGLGVLMIFSLTTLSDPRTSQRWLPLLLAGFSAGFLMLRGRSYVDRWQAITLAGTSVLIVAAVVVRYVLVLRVAAVGVDRRRDHGFAAGGGPDGRGSSAQHHLQPAVPQVCGMD